MCLRGAVHQARRPGALQYLTYGRMQRAQRLVRAGSAGIAQIAAPVGCQTEPAFSRAFEHWAGIAPGSYRCGR
jgi:AraC-like DNA-binding protein